MNIKSVDDLQLLHIAAGKEIRQFRNSIKHAEKFEERADDLVDKTYCLTQAKAYRELAQECAERYQEIYLQIITITENINSCHQLLPALLPSAQPS